MKKLFVICLFALAGACGHAPIQNTKYTPTASLEQAESVVAYYHLVAINHKDMSLDVKITTNGRVFRMYDCGGVSDCNNVNVLAESNDGLVYKNSFTTVKDVFIFTIEFKFEKIVNKANKDEPVLDGNMTITKTNMNTQKREIVVLDFIGEQVKRIK